MVYTIHLLKFESPFLSILPIYSIMTCWSWKFQSQCYLLYLSFGLISFHCSIKWPSNNFLLSRCNGSKHCKAFGQEIDVKNQKLSIKFAFAGWIENPIKSVVLTFPLDKIVFPTVTLCPRDSRPDRWGSVIKIFDHLDTDCGSKR